MEKPPMEWIDKLFNCMNEFYGERWTRLYKLPHYESLAKTVWQSGLTGCTYEEIRNVLVYLKRAAQNAYASPPHCMEFFQFAKRNAEPTIDYSNATKKCSPEVARAALDGIRKTLTGKDCST